MQLITGALLANRSIYLTIGLFPLNTLFMKRKDIKQKIEEKALNIPLDVLLTGKRNRNLTKKMQGFAVDLATGETKAQAYRNNYDTQAKPKAVGDQAHKLAKHPAIVKEVDLITEALEAAAAHSAAQLRGLVIGRLTKEALNMESPAAARISAIKALGQVSEIAAFTERKEIRNVQGSDDIKAQLLEMIQGAMHNQARTIDQDANQVEIDNLLAEISNPAAKEIPENAPPPAPDAPFLENLQGGNEHSNPHKQSPSEKDSGNQLEILPVEQGEGGIKNSPDWKEDPIGNTPVSGFKTKG